MSAMVNAGLASSDRPDWNTPENVLALIRRFGVIGLDPCSNANSLVGAAEEWSLERDGDSLPKDWTGYGLIYVNPPYGSEIVPFARKMQDEGKRGAEIIALLPARTDARWWQHHITSARAVCFWKGRLKFLGAPSSAPFPSALAYWGPRPERFADFFGDAGWVVQTAGKSATPKYHAPAQTSLFAPLLSPEGR